MTAQRTAFRRSSTILWLVLGLFGFAGCEGGGIDSYGSWRGEIRLLPGGGEHVANPAFGIWSGTAGWTIEEEFRIGAPDGDGPDVFGRVTALAVGLDGRVHVFDGHAGELRTFSEKGEFEGRFGRRGEGPEEFLSVIGIATAPDGAPWLVDPENVRYTVLRQQRSEAHRRPSPVYRLPWAGGFAEDGSFYDMVVLPGEIDEALIRLDSSGMPVDTFPIISPSLHQPRAGGITFQLPFAPRALRTFDSRGAIWTGTTHEFRFVQISPEGDTLRIVTREEGAPPLSPAQRDSARVVARQIQERFGVTVQDGMLPTSAPVVRWFVIDDAGHLWVALEGAEGQDRMDVFDPAGRYLGRVELPFRLASSVRPVLQDDRFVAVTEDELGIQSVVWARLVR